jgi:hypothetical protein
MIGPNNEELSKRWFDFYISEIESAPFTEFKKIDDYFLCPCCHFPTLSTRGSFDICLLCNWEDDGQDNHNADKVLGGPNQSYSLTEARDNFKKYLTSYRPSDTYHFERTTINKSSDGKITRDLTEIKKQIIDKYDFLLQCETATERKKVFEQVADLAKRLGS